MVLAAACAPWAGALETASGKLSTVIDKDDWSGVTSLTLTGTMDARDFKFIAESLPSLANLDISGVTIEEYSDKQPLVANYTYYPANELPKYLLMGTRLTSVALPSTLTSIGDGAFAGCGELQSVAIPATVTTIGSYAFSGDAKLTAVTGGDGVETVGDYAFSHDGALASVAGMPRLKSIGGYAFLEAGQLASFSFPASLKTVGEGAFRLCGLTNADLSACTDIDVVGAWAFADNTSMTTLSLPASLKTVGEGAFFYSTALQRVALPEGLVTINDYAFMGGKAVTEAVLPEGLNEIGDYALNDWSAIASLVIPSTMEYIGTGAMRNWTGLTELTCNAMTPPALGESVWEYVDHDKVNIHVPSASETAYRMADQWREFFKSSSARTPAADDIRVAVEGNVLTVVSTDPVAAVQIVDLSGVTVKTAAPHANHASLDMPGLGAQVYVVRCVLENGSERIFKISRH